MCPCNYFHSFIFAGSSLIHHQFFQFPPACAGCFDIGCTFRLLQRYQNVKAELEAQQNLERVRMEKLVQSGALTASRR